jgi:hypothetical protein
MQKQRTIPVGGPAVNWEQHVKNREALPAEELAKYYGRQVAWNREGTAVVASGDDEQEVFEAARAAGYSLDQLVFSYVPHPSEICLGGAFLPTEEKGA